MIIFFQYPWLEAIILEAGGLEIVSLNYVAIRSWHPQIVSVLPGELSKMFLSGTQKLFDVMVTFLNLDHSSLGRYTLKQLIQMIFYKMGGKKRPHGHFKTNIYFFSLI